MGPGDGRAASDEAAPAPGVLFHLAIRSEWDRRLTARVEVEALDGPERFPHLYGPLDLGAVVAAIPLSCLADGRLDLDGAVADAVADAVAGRLTIPGGGRGAGPSGGGPGTAGRQPRGG